MHSCYGSNTTCKFFATLDTCACTIDLAITRNTCVDKCSLNCLNLFLKYKIWLDLFSVCVLDV